MISRIVLILVLAGFLAGCGSGSSGGKKSVVAAFYPLAYAAERIGGPAFDVWNLTPPGAEPHDLELTRRLAASGVLIGIHLLDHIIVGDGRYVSFRQAGLL